ncbi:MAG: DUF4276 family protein [Minicystis sp.]
MLEEKFNRPIDEWEVEGDTLPRIHDRSEDANGYERKVLRAIQAAEADGCSSVAIVVDRDRTEGRQRLAQLQAGRTKAEQQGEALAERTAIGVAIETVEAWLLADEQALNQALRLAPPVGALPAPEGLDGRAKTERHPKVVLRKLIEQQRSGVDAPYDEIAERVQLEVLEQRCSGGFATFAEEVRRRCE